MCMSCNEGGKVSRRSLLAGVGAVTATLGLAACSTGATTPPSQGPTSADVLPSPIGNGKYETVALPSPIGNTKLQIILLGTMAGPPIEPDRAGISTAVVIDGEVYVVDCGRASATQYVRAGLQQKRLNSIFLTHLHADHIADYYNFFLLGGHIPNRAGDHLDKPVKVYGPGPAGGLPEAFGGRDVPVIGSDPTPGTAEMTSMLTDAYAYSTNIFMRDTGIRDISSLIDLHEIGVPDVGATYTNTAPPMDPFIVMEDDRVRVTGILVPHGPVYPSFAFRFDTDHGSITFSGDTTYSPNVIKLAKDSDVLIHEAINLRGGTMPPNQQSHMLESHVEIQKVGPIAESCGAKQLVLSHIGDVFQSPINTQQWKSWAQQGYSGPVTVGIDLQRIILA